MLPFSWCTDYTCKPVQAIKNQKPQRFLCWLSFRLDGFLSLWDASLVCSLIRLHWCNQELKNLGKHTFSLINGHVWILSGGLSFVAIFGAKHLLCVRGKKTLTNAAFKGFKSLPHLLPSCSDIAFQTIDLAWMIAVPLCWLWMSGRKGQGVKVGWSSIWTHVHSQSRLDTGTNLFWMVTTISLNLEFEAINDQLISCLWLWKGNFNLT